MSNALASAGARVAILGRAKFVTGVVIPVDGGFSAFTGVQQLATR
ncbi:MAG: hypothetical protein ABJB66_17065 [Gemmatimonadaceae bacterium]